MEKKLSRFKGKLVKMIKMTNSKLDDYSISPKIRQVLLHWGYELAERDSFIYSTNQCIKMTQYWFNREDILQKTKENYSKERAAKYYLKNKEAKQEKSRN